MKKLRHTPGPWKITRRSDDYIDPIEQVGEIKPGFTHADDAWLEITEPDARLIAAAPEMLEALISAYSEIKEYTELAKMYGEPEYTKEIIEKATGLPIDEVLK
jgi:hypothetical protein